MSRLSKIVAFLFGCVFGSILAIAGFAWGGSESKMDTVRLTEGSINEVEVSGTLPACSLTRVEPPRIIADFGRPAGIEDITLEIKKCRGAVALAGGSWRFGDDDASRERKPLGIAMSMTGGEFSCDTEWTMRGITPGPVDFIAEWRIVKVQEERCSLLSKSSGL